MPAPYRPMLLSAAADPPEGDGWAHEPKLDGWRAIVAVGTGGVRVWSRTGKEWTSAVPEMQALAALGDAVFDGELVVAASDGRADFDLLSARINGADGDAPVTRSVFDLLELHGKALLDRPWEHRRRAVEELDVARRTGSVAQLTLSSPDGRAMHAATAAAGAEGTVSKRRDSPYRPGRSRSWVKAKHRWHGVFAVAGWRPTAPGRPGGLVLVEDGEPIGVATVALADAERRALVALFRRYGRVHPTGTITIPEDCLTAVVHYTSRTPAYGRLREATVTAVRPVGALPGRPGAG